VFDGFSSPESVNLIFVVLDYLGPRRSSRDVTGNRKETPEHARYPAAVKPAAQGDIPVIWP
jgi:hypothetical protein